MILFLLLIDTIITWHNQTVFRKCILHDNVYLMMDTSAQD